MTTAPGPWQVLQDPPPTGLVEARKQLHWAAQVASSVAKTLIEALPDDSHQAFSWLPGRAAMASGLVPGSHPFRCALRPADLHLLILSDHDVAQEEFPLSGRTLDSAYHWLEEEVRRQLGRPLPAPLARPAEIEDHAVAEGARFSIRGGEAFAELGRYLGDAYRLLHDHAAGRPGASPIRLWPHHLDLAVLIEVAPAADGREARTVGVGLSPGDTEHPLPYLYVTPWPAPQETAPTDLPAGGEWHRGGWTGARLSAPALVAGGDGADQQQRAGAFLDAAIEAFLGSLAG